MFSKDAIIVDPPQPPPRNFSVGQVAGFLQFQTNLAKHASNNNKVATTDHLTRTSMQQTGQFLRGPEVATGHNPNLPFVSNNAGMLDANLRANPVPGALGSPPWLHQALQQQQAPTPQSGPRMLNSQGSQGVVNMPMMQQSSFNAVPSFAPMPAGTWMRGGSAAMMPPQPIMSLPVNMMTTGISLAQQQQNLMSNISMHQANMMQQQKGFLPPNLMELVAGNLGSTQLAAESLINFTGKDVYRDTNAGDSPSNKTRIKTLRKVKRRKRSSSSEDDDDDDEEYFSRSTSSEENFPTRSKFKRRQSGENGSESSGDADSGTPRPERSRRQLPDKVGADSALEDSYADYNGEHRLVIDFESFGTVVDSPERLGKKGIIPDGLAGSFIMYSERWFFEIKYLPNAPGTEESASQSMKHRCIEWRIRNDAWKEFHSVVETREDALRRNHRGVSLCNRTFTDAMEMRAKEFEQLLRDERAKPEPDASHIAFLESRIGVFRPKRFSEGPLLFGLRHKAVQRRQEVTQQPAVADSVAAPQ